MKINRYEQVQMHLLKDELGLNFSEILLIQMRSLIELKPILTLDVSSNLIGYARVPR